MNVEQLEAKTGEYEAAVAEAEKSLTEWQDYEKENGETEETTANIATAKDSVDAAKTGLKDHKEAIKKAKADARAAAKAEKDAEKERKREEREAKAAEKEKAKQEREAQKAARVRQNGKLHPLPNSKCGQAWGIFDELSAETGEPAKLADAVERAEAKGLNSGNVRAEYGNWRTFHGIPPQGRAKKAVEPKTEGVNAEGEKSPENAEA